MSGRAGGKLKPLKKPKKEKGFDDDDEVERSWCLDSAYANDPIRMLTCNAHLNLHRRLLPTSSPS